MSCLCPSLWIQKGRELQAIAPCPWAYGWIFKSVQMSKCTERHLEWIIKNSYYAHISLKINCLGSFESPVRYLYLLWGYYIALENINILTPKLFFLQECVGLGAVFLRMEFLVKERDLHQSHSPVARMPVCTWGNPDVNVCCAWFDISHIACECRSCWSIFHLSL